MIIYPPFIGETIPGFTQTEIKIPFQCNPAVSFKDDVKHFCLRIKSLINSDILCNLTVANNSMNVKYTEETNNGEITFRFGTWKPTVSQYYKFQLSTSDSNAENAPADSFYAYSQVAIGRCVSSQSGLEIGIYELDNNTLASNIEFTGYYKRAIENESLYSYEFNLMDSNNNIIETTGVQRWDVNNDTKRIKMVNGTENNFSYSEPKFILKKLLEYNTKYKLQFSITTINGLKKSITKEFLKRVEYMSFFKGDLVATQRLEEQDNGYISVKPTGNAVHGKFILERSKDKKTWERLTEFEMAEGADLRDFVYEDFAIEPSCSYTYALRQYGQGELYNIYSKQILSNTIVANGEDMFLSDSKKQLKIRFNPKVSSFKDTILEQKTDTIGSKYPFFFRNNKVRYKEIPISGLISYHMDENELFMTNEELNLQIITSKEDKDKNTRTTDLVAYNIAAEKAFKLAVNEWLTNGKPKLFRSPTEGTYLIRLMNVSLSPDETLGRMLHTFSATGYEIDDSNYETLKKYNVVKENDMKILERTKFITWPSENNKDRRIYGYIKNLVWKDPFPSMESYIGLKDLEDKNAIEFPKFYNPQGDFRTPENKFYGILLDGITSKTATLIFEQQDMPEYNEKADEFQKMINSGSLITKWITVDSSNSQELTKIKQIHTIIAERDINSGARAWIVLVKNNGYEKDINEDYITNNGALTPLSPTYTTISLDNNGVLELNDLNTVDSISFGKVVPKTDEHGNPIIENGKEIKKIIYEDDKGNPIENGAVVTMLVTKSEEEVS